MVRPVVPPYPKTLTCEHIRDGRDLETRVDLPRFVPMEELHADFGRSRSAGLCHPRDDELTPDVDQRRVGEAVRFDQEILRDTVAAGQSPDRFVGLNDVDARRPFHERPPQQPPGLLADDPVWSQSVFSLKAVDRIERRAAEDAIGRLSQQAELKEDVLGDHDVRSERTPPDDAGRPLRRPGESKKHQDRDDQGEAPLRGLDSTWNSRCPFLHRLTRALLGRPPTAASSLGSSRPLLLGKFSHLPEHIRSAPGYSSAEMRCKAVKACSNVSTGINRRPDATALASSKFARGRRKTRAPATLLAWIF